MEKNTTNNTLYNSNGVSLGKATQSRFDNDSSEWKNVASGSHYFFWFKANDGSTLKGDAKITH